MGANNMDSVFANCTDEELSFDVMFDEEDTIIDIIAGVDEAGVPLTGEDFDWDSLKENDDMVGENPDFDYQKDGDASGSEKDAEGTKDIKPEIGGEVGDGKEVSGKENSAESQAYDDKKEIDDAIGLNDKEQIKLEISVTAEAVAIYEDINSILEFDVKAAASSIKDKIVKAIKSLISKIEGAIDKIKNKDKNKEGKLKTLLGKVKSLFNRANGSEDKDDLEECGKITQEMCDELAKIMNSSGIHESVESILEFDVKAVANSIKNKIVTAIQNLIKKIQNAIDKIKNKDKNKEGKLKTLLGKVKSLFNRAKSSDNEKELNDINEITQEMCDELSEIMNNSAIKEAAEDEGPLKDDDAAEREGETSPTAVNTESGETDTTPNADAPTEDDATKAEDEKCCKESAPDVTDPSDQEILSLSEAIINKIKEKAAKRESVEEGSSCCPNCGKNPCDCDGAEREGKCKHDTTNKEGVKSDVVGAAVTSSNGDDHIIDIEDEDARKGKTEKQTGTEGVKEPVIGAALESVVLEDSDNIDDLLNDDNEIIDIDIDEEVVPDKVKEDDTSNDIDLDIKNTQETVSYTGWRKVSEAVSDSKIKEELEDEQEENAIEAINKEPDNPDSNLKLSYDYDDDELIDITIDND